MVLSPPERNIVGVGGQGSFFAKFLEFRAFIKEIWLGELPLLERGFTRFHSNGSG